MHRLTSTALYSDGTYRHILTLRGRACASHVRLVRSSCPLVPVGSICTNLSRRYFFVCRGQATVAVICTYLRHRQLFLDKVFCGGAVFPLVPVGSICTNLSRRYFFLFVVGKQLLPPSVRISALVNFGSVSNVGVQENSRTVK